MSDTYRRVTLTLWTTSTPGNCDLSDLVREAEQGNGVIVHSSAQTFTAEQARAHPDADSAGSVYPELLNGDSGADLGTVQTYDLNLRAEVSVPEQYAPALNAFGNVRGFTLPDGSVLKPQVIFERHMEADDSVQQDLTTAELTALGVQFDYVNDARELTLQER